MKLIILSFLLSFSSYADLRRGEGADVPVGTTLSIAGPSCPSGFLSADGSAVSRTTYSKLFTQIGTSYGSGDGSTTFNLPKHDWHIDANIGGTTTTVSVTSSTYTEISASNFDLIVNSSKGSADAQIACSNGNSSTGLTCNTGQESIGIAFIPFPTKLFEICASFSATVDSTNSGNTASTAVFQLVETPNNSTTILQEGGERKEVYVYKQNVNTGGITVSAPFTTCGIFNFNTASLRTIRLMYESNSLTPNFVIYADRLASQGQRDIKFTVRPLTRLGNCIKY